VKAHISLLNSRSADRKPEAEPGVHDQHTQMNNDALPHVATGRSGEAGFIHDISNALLPQKGRRPSVPESAQQWCMLRAFEWNNWPLFVAQPAVPIVLIFVPWWIVVPALVMINLLWSKYSESTVNLRLALDGALFARFKWFAAIGAGAFSILHGDIAIGIVAACWPLMTLILVFAHPPTRAARLADLFMVRLKSVW